MRDNPLKARLLGGGQAFGVMAFEFFTPGLPAIVRSAGAEFLLLDMEHSGVGFETVKAQIALCRGIELVPMARVPAAEYHFIARLLDAGAMGVMVPMVETAEQAAFIVACTRYPPHGRRGSAFGVVAHDDYAEGDVVSKMTAANSRTLVMCLIETARGLENVDAIAAVPGVDVLWLGHADLTSFMGIPGQFAHPDYLAAVDKIVAACRAHAKVPAFLAPNAQWGSDYLAKGFRLLAYSHDVGLLQCALREGLAQMRAACAPLR